MDAAALMNTGYGRADEFLRDAPYQADKEPG